MNCTNNTEEDTSQHAWSRYLPLFTESCHGGIGIGICGGGCIADAKALNSGGFDPRHCESTRAIVRSVLAHCEGDERLQTTNRAAIAEDSAHLVQGGEDPARSSVGHDAVQA
jgi:sulfatase maturation enzyme AslB (radical SAM superfamily)